jgi:hypothetical protein
MLLTEHRLTTQVAMNNDHLLLQRDHKSEWAVSHFTSCHCGLLQRDNGASTHLNPEHGVLG